MSVHDATPIYPPPEEYMAKLREYDRLHQEWWESEESRRLTSCFFDLCEMAERLWSNPVHRKIAVEGAAELLKQEKKETT